MFRDPIHSSIISTAELAAALVEDLPPDLQEIVVAHFFDGESIFTIQRCFKLKHRDLEAALGNMRRRYDLRASGPCLM